MLGAAAKRIVQAIRKPRNNADGAIAAKPEGTGLSGRSAVSRRSPMGIYHWLRVASCISSRQASVATTRGLCRGSLSSRRPSCWLDVYRYRILLTRPARGRDRELRMTGDQRDDKPPTAQVDDGVATWHPSTPARGDEFLRVLAHELRNHIAPIRNAAHLIRLRADSDPEVSFMVDMIER